MNKRWLLLGLVAASCGGAATAPTTTSATTAPANEDAIAARFAAEINCGDDAMDMLRAWCPVTHLGALPFVPPAKAITLFGISQPIRPGAKIRDALLGAGMRISTLTLDAEHASIRDVDPETPAEHDVLVDLASRIIDELDHHRGKLHVSRDLSSFAAAQQANATSGHAFTLDGMAAHYVAKAPTFVYSQVNAFVVLEQEGDGVWVSIYPIAALSADE